MKHLRNFSTGEVKPLEFLRGLKIGSLSGIAVPGYATIVVGMMFFSGIQLLALGIMSEYVGRIYDEVKRRPVYLLRQRTGQGLSQD